MILIATIRKQPTVIQFLKGYRRTFATTSSILILLPFSAASATIHSNDISASTSTTCKSRIWNTTKVPQLASNVRLNSTSSNNNNWFSRNMCVTTDSDEMKLPTTMTGPPISSLLPPGECQFTTEWTSVPLLQRWRVSPTTMVLRFGLPDTNKSLQLSTCACILAHTKLEEEDVVRPYTPISTNANVGYFDLLVKHYGPTAKMSRHMHDTMQIGDTLDFKHIEFNVKIQAPFGNPKHIGMIIGGTGVSPMIQALHAILGSEDMASTKVTVLYGSKVANDILALEILDQWSKDYKDRLDVIHILSDEPTENSDWTGLRGFINQGVIEQYLPQPSENPLLFICGPPPMYNAISGPREEKEVTGILGNMGYQTEHVCKF
jgi:cytochrome-b5 reductase